jgi:transcription elongation factor Elf1
VFYLCFDLYLIFADSCLRGTALSEPVDVYHEWLDKADELNRAAQTDDRPVVQRQKRHKAVVSDDDLEAESDGAGEDED